jgi:hypothetical protein
LPSPPLPLLPLFRLWYRRVDDDADDEDGRGARGGQDRRPSPSRALSPSRKAGPAAADAPGTTGEEGAAAKAAAAPPGSGPRRTTAKRAAARTAAAAFAAAGTRAPRLLHLLGDGWLLISLRGEAPGRGRQRRRFAVAAAPHRRVAQRVLPCLSLQRAGERAPKRAGSKGEKEDTAGRTCSGKDGNARGAKRRPQLRSLLRLLGVGGGKGDVAATVVAAISKVKSFRLSVYTNLLWSLNRRETT